MATVQMADSHAGKMATSRRIAGATGIMMAAIFGSRILGLVRDAVISYRFGQSYESDIYYAAFILPDLLFFLIAGGALSSAFIPVFTEHVTHGREKEAWETFSTVATCMFVVILGFVILGEIFTHGLVRLLTGFGPKEAQDTVGLTRIVLPAQLCFFLGGLMMGAQQARHRFLIPSLGPIVYNIGIILGGVLLAPFLGPAGLCWGALGGAIVGNFAMQAVALRQDGARFRPSLNFRHPDAVRVWKLMLPVILGIALPQVSILFNRIFATQLGKGPLSALTRANMLMQVPLGVFAQAMAVAIFPTLSALAAKKQYDELRSTTSQGIRALLFLTIPASLLMIVLAVPIIQAILQQGKFTAADTPMTALALQFYCAGIFAWSAQSILGRAFYAMHDTVTPVVVGTGVTVVFIPMNLLFMNTLGMGFRGLALATTVAAILHMVVMMIVLRRRLGGIEGGKMLASLSRIVLAAAIASLACWAVRYGLDRVFGDPLAPGLHVKAVKLHALLTTFLGFGVGAAVYAGCAVALRVEELHQALALLRRRKRAPVAAG